VNKAKTSRKLYRIRQRRFRHAVNAMIKTIVEDAYQLGISKIVLGDVATYLHLLMWL
jgi:transposase